ncbi:hypothetical protein PUN28_012067 [Cardiocondyla obscurior]|uniref:Uncharacterized protein n=1 Tax=Cardiocondyla obscurior TaxID=286306 RepID=A0AAW2FB82_9HYME
MVVSLRSENRSFNSKMLISARSFSSITYREHKHERAAHIKMGPVTEQAGIIKKKKRKIIVEDWKGTKNPFGSNVQLRQWRNLIKQTRLTDASFNIARHWSRNDWLLFVALRWIQMKRSIAIRVHQNEREREELKGGNLERAGETEMKRCEAAA